MGLLPRPSASRYFWWLAFVDQPLVRSSNLEQDLVTRILDSYVILDFKNFRYNLYHINQIH